MFDKILFQTKSFMFGIFWIGYGLWMAIRAGLIPEMLKYWLEKIFGWM